ncbi:hypothetical protein Tco_0856372 [Tanacetum coccineum]|uniref:Uncharacterized protein n=1 Tax=Tanacetum coccineum TaxID=301880 RepID=A0ABQ5B353_9ASTR
MDLTCHLPRACLMLALEGFPSSLSVLQIRDTFHSLNYVYLLTSCLSVVVVYGNICSGRLKDGIIMLELVACSIPSWFSEIQLCLVAFNAEKMIDVDLSEERLQVFSQSLGYRFLKSFLAINPHVCSDFFLTRRRIMSVNIELLLIKPPVRDAIFCTYVIGTPFFNPHLLLALAVSADHTSAGMVQADSGVAGLSSSGSGFHQSFLTLSFGRSFEGDMEEEEAEATEKILMLLKYLEHQMRLLEEVEEVAMNVETQEEFLVTHVSFFSSCGLCPDLLGVDLSNHAPMTFAACHTNSCDLHELHRICLQTIFIGEYPSYPRQADHISEL